MPDLPDILIERRSRFLIARDDLIAGGTKRRALRAWLPVFKNTSFVYAASVYGSGGWALAEACRELGYSCKLYLSQSVYRPEWTKSFSDIICWKAPQTVSMLSDTMKDECRGDVILPSGFDDPGFITQLANVFMSVECAAAEIWLPCVSGVMTRAAMAAWPDKTVHAVCAARHHGDIAGALPHYAAEKYHQPARLPPPYPANRFSDAKVWDAALRHGLNNALIWNTSR